MSTAVEKVAAEKGKLKPEAKPAAENAKPAAVEEAQAHMPPPGDVLMPSVEAMFKLFSKQFETMEHRHREEVEELRKEFRMNAKRNECEGSTSSSMHVREGQCEVGTSMVQERRAALLKKLRAEEAAELAAAEARSVIRARKIANLEHLMSSDEF